MADDKHLNGSADREREGDKKSAMNKLNDLTNSFCINGTYGFGVMLCWEVGPPALIYLLWTRKGYQISPKTKGRADLKLRVDSLPPPP